VEEHKNGKVKKKLSENIYIVPLLTDYLIGVTTLFRLLQKFFSKTIKNLLKPYKTHKYIKITKK
jgi:hypothetical protein